MTSDIPGVQSRRLAALLQRYESRGVTHVSEHGPIFWESAEDAQVVDADGNVYLDFGSAFSVASVGHSNPRVARAIAEQARRLMAAMADLHPSAIRVELLAGLAAVAPGQLSKSYLCSTGAEAVEAALKTALLYNGRPKIIAFNGAYHGVSLGALEVCGLPFFRSPFDLALTQRAIFVDYPRQREGRSALDRTVSAIREALRANDDIGALIVEPIQGRGGMVVPPDGFLRALRELCTEYELVLIFDEVYTGFGRTGSLFACQHEEVVPDLLCLGKALGNGFPVSAAIGTPQIMDAWPLCEAEALHTSTFLGNPMGCAAALATLAELERQNLPARARNLGEKVAMRLQQFRSYETVIEVRGRGLFWGIEMRDAEIAQKIAAEALQQRLLLFAEGAVVCVLPPLTIAESKLDQGLDILAALTKSAKG